MRCWPVVVGTLLVACGGGTATHPVTPPPAEPSWRDDRCLPADDDAFCAALMTMLEVRDLLHASETMPCGIAASRLDGWASSNAPRVRNIHLLQARPQPALDAFQGRHDVELLGTATAALDLMSRCPHDSGVSMALGRAGFAGGAPGP